ncbi:MAG TPA: ribbon-helix-helix domain-containing protein [Candidatus Saccharimonadales bacterium]|nr:ribbon-helix-helix domain-containing protein [Candidatus Saccharimonadales bacterium]
MRSVVNISLPSQLETIVIEAVKRGNYASKSEFFRHLLRNYLENDLAKELEDSRKELSAGKGKLLTSLKDLR